MRSRYWWLLLFLASLYMLPARASLPEGSNQSAFSESRVISSFRARRFADLEVMHAGLLASKERTVDGGWKLSDFYSWIDKAVTGARGDEMFWVQVQGLFSEWRKRFPDSVAMPIANFRALKVRAMLFRGEGSIGSVSSSNLAKFHELIEQGRELLDASKPNSAIDPVWYSSMLYVAALQDWSSKSVLSLLREASQAEPYYYRSYTVAAFAVSPKWGGSAEAVEEVARIALARTRRWEGYSAYAWVYLTIARTDFRTGGIFLDSNVSWPTLRKGLIDMVSLYPGRENINAAIEMACMAQDRELTRRFIGLAKNRLEPDRWDRTRSHVNECGIWAVDRPLIF